MGDVVIPLLPTGVVIFVQILAFAVWISKVGERANNAKDGIKSLESKCDECIRKVSRLEGLMERDTRYLKKESPLSLTDQGTLLLINSGMQKYIEDNKDELLKSFDGVDVPLDIQDRAKEIMREKIQSNTDVKNYIFKEGLSVEDVASVAGVALRDIVLKSKNIDIKNLDT